MSVTPGSVPCVATTTTKRTRPAYACTECGWTTVKWVGRCGECQAWGTVTDSAPAQAGPRTTAVAPTRSAARPIAEIDVEAARATPTGVGELDRVLGGGLVPGAVVLLAGEPGVGKSTLLLAVASNFATGATDAVRDPAGTSPGRVGESRTVLYVTGEESAGQVRLRAERIGALAPSLLLASETDLATVLGHVAAAEPDLLIVDSVQTIASAEVDGAPGGTTQVREVAAALIAAAKERGVPVVLVGHVTKDGTIAGPRTLEHLVDVVCQFEGDRHSRLRMVRAVKNRYGPTDEVGCFDLSEHGIEGLPDPSGLFLSHTAAAAPGSCVTVTLEGRRPLAVELQSLVAPSPLANPRRATSGVDSSRLAMILAVLHRHAGLRVADQDVYVSTVGGARVTEPAADLAAALALVSARTEEPLPPATIAVGEVGLAGDIRPVTGLERRLGEVARLGYRRAVVPAGTGVAAPEGMELLEAQHIREAMTLARAAGDR
ncbi:DNA repair protein RadA [Myceligenerans pegani]|uniref:DNA repair protein RadA n=1 Tax=Myceligenerans pegani TaxID=2776917 RepID=A0ABR9N4S4_9MICO|nr:DNA repair protein RadA [Myceligenerans sp. TRM 65318]MBE1878670.1 DNA repair protein RadA [Myceligenerans sp. TRM 65318]MBE3020941.1 DNA repair protein RadA [Myceligenerans sp. TRM 65318]